ncbi:MAG: replicative DNA helicase [Bdellovibrionaceae bacterium]|nr:replicative DNA helicase [Pseudobdellovibrionaceae bacterium]
MDNKVPPQNLDAEKSILGGLMLDQDAWDEITELVSEQDFYKPAHRKIYHAIFELNKKGQPTDLITISNYLMDSQELEQVGGAPYLAEIIEFTPSSANITYYAKIVNEKSLIRKVISTSTGIIGKAYEQDFDDIHSFIDGAEAEIFSIAENRTQAGLVGASELVKASLEKLEELYANQGEVTGVPSGFLELDEMTAGFQPGEMTIIAARPSMGKTAFSLNLALHAALNEKKKVAYFSVEMAKEAVMTRLLSIVSSVSLSDLRVGKISDKAWPQLINSAARLSETSIYIDDTSGISPFEIRAKARRMSAKEGLDLIIIDYLQLMSMKQKIESREREVSEISKTLKAIAKELKVPVLALAQLNRSVEGRTDRRPMLSDLRESGSIEQDADIIMMLFREDYYDRDNPDIKGVAEVIIGKQRNGPTGKVKLKWVPERGIFKNLEMGGPGESPPPPSMAPPGVTPISNGAPKNFAPGG